MPDPPDPAADSRAILHPARMAEHVRLDRFSVPDAFEGILDWVWSVEWDLQPGEVHRQDVLSLPAVNISVGTGPPPGPHPPPGPYAVSPRVVGVARRRTTRVLSGSGWNVAAKTTVGGLGGLIATSVAAYTDKEVAMGEVLPLDAGALGAAMAAAQGASARSQLLLAALEPVRAQADPQRRRTAREVSALADAAANKPDLYRVGELAAYAGMSVRTVQRLFSEYAGISPTWMLRRLRLIEAAERVARGQQARWAEVAADLGYSDQAHLTRDFTAAVGQSPAAYAAAQREFDV
ncbi:MAG: helix-turn-helix domain-containing protein [Tetrasphaera sp.]